MLTVAFLLLQVAAAEATQTAEAAPANAAVVSADAPDEPKMKRVCRKVMDPRVNSLSSRTLQCKYVPADAAEVASR